MNPRTSFENIEDKTFESLIMKYARAKNWDFVNLMFLSYGVTLSTRELERKNLV